MDRYEKNKADFDKIKCYHNLSYFTTLSSFWTNKESRGTNSRDTPLFSLSMPTKISCVIVLLCIMHRPLLARILSQFEPFQGPVEKRHLLNPSPLQLGSLHNHIISNVHERLGELPQSVDFYHMIVQEEVSAALCEDNDNQCKVSIHEGIIGSHYELKEFYSAGNTFDIEKIFPHEFDEDIKMKLTEIYDAVHNLKEQSLDEALTAMNIISENVAKSNMKQHEKDMIQGVASIAMGSSMLWVDALDDPENKFHKIYHRRMEALTNQTDETKFITHETPKDTTEQDSFGFVISDVLGSIKGAIIPGVLFSLRLDTASSIFSSVLQKSVIDSLGAIGMLIPSPPEVARCIAGNRLNETVRPMMHNVLPNCNYTDVFGEFWSFLEPPV